MSMKIRCLAVLAALALVLPPLAAAAAAEAAPSGARAAGAAVEYAELEHEIGAELAIDTTFNTTRRGVLVKYTNPTLTLRLGPEAGSIDLSVPRDTVRRITILKPAPPASTTQ
ncbi:MAG TPA: hypothetical protein VGC30_04390, partial [Dokdonella sp.]